MKLILTKIMGILVIVLFTVTVNAKTKDKLWGKAVRIATKNQNYVPGIISEKEKVYNEDGKLEESSITKYSVIKDYQITFYRLTINFNNIKNRAWYAKSMYSNMNIKAKIMPFVTFKGKIKTTYKYDKFWKIR